jgi:prohibitin 2
MTYYDDWNKRLKKADSEDSLDTVDKNKGGSEGSKKWREVELVEEEEGVKEGSFIDATRVPYVSQDGSGDEEATTSAKWWSRRKDVSTERREWKFFDTKYKLWAWGIFGLAVLVTGITLLATSLQKLSSNEYGVEYNVHKKKLSDAAKTGGLHLGPPGYEFIRFPSTFITEDLPDGTCVSKDGLRVQFSVSFQYAIPQEWLIPTVLTYRGFEKWADVVSAAGTSAVQHSCAEFNISNFQSQRGVIQGTMEQNLRLKLEGKSGKGADGVYARAISLQLRNVELPEEYQEAVREKQSANEDISLAQNQRKQETTKAQTKLLSASEEARKILDNSNNDAELILTEARLKAQETLFAFETESKTIVDVKERLNLTTAGVLAYLANQLLADVPNLKVSAAEPARLSRKDEL